MLRLRDFPMKYRSAGTREEGIFQFMGLVYSDNALDLRAFHKLYTATEEDSGCPRNGIIYFWW